MSYAQARLMVGITGVGTVVVAATVALLLGWPGRLSAFRSDVAAIGTVLAIHALLLAPFDLFGGWILPRRFRRSNASFGKFLVRWLRGILVQVLVVGGIAIAVLTAGQAGEFPAAVAAFGAAMIVLVAAQGTIARCLAGLTMARRTDDVRTVRSSDVGFTGGIVGLPGRERLVVPERWHNLLDPEGLEAQLARWSSTVETGGRTIGLGVALLWNLAGFTLAATLPGADVATVPGLTNVALGFTLWSFLGLLLLPSVSRPAVFAADRAASGVATEDRVLHETLARLDRQQDDEPTRAAGVETIFHPIPALSRRVEALSSGSAPRLGAWHAARTALFLSWAGFGFLSRAVHCNSGRPELWVLLPCD